MCVYTDILEPHKPRPETTASTARNLVHGALGLRRPSSKEHVKEHSSKEHTKEHLSKEHTKEHSSKEHTREHSSKEHTKEHSSKEHTKEHKRHSSKSDGKFRVLCLQ